MRLEEVAQALDLKELTPATGARGRRTGDADITRGYASDLLSDVLAHAPAGGLLVTLQVHLNVIAVASHAGLRAVIFSCGRVPDDDIIERAAEEGLSLYSTPADTFDVVGRLLRVGPQRKHRHEAASRRTPCLSDEPAAMEQGLASIRAIRADLHIHTALSPCGSEEMTPPAIVAAALARGLDMIAVSDHNTAGNVGAVQQAAEDGRRQARGAGRHGDDQRRGSACAGPVPRSRRGRRGRRQAPRLSAGGGRRLLLLLRRAAGLGGRRPSHRFRDRRLALATPLDLTETVELVHSVGGLAIAAHVDRKSFSVFSQLGFFPEDAGFDGVELSRHCTSRSCSVWRNSRHWACPSPAPPTATSWRRSEPRRPNSGSPSPPSPSSCWPSPGRTGGPWEAGDSAASGRKGGAHA